MLLIPIIKPTKSKKYVPFVQNSYGKNNVKTSEYIKTRKHKTFTKSNFVKNNYIRMFLNKTTLLHKANFIMQFIITARIAYS